MIRRHQSGKDSHRGMAQRGVSRPEMHGDAHEHGGSHAEHGDSHGGHDEMHAPDHGGGMSQEQRRHMSQMHHQKTLWAPLTVALLGVWLVSAPFTFGYASEPIVWSDLASGVLLIVLGGIWAKAPGKPSVPWAACFVGIWLQLAPLVFWAKNPAAYAMDTFIGVWAIALTILIPGMPGMIAMMKMGPDTPPGWSYNPSSWVQRAPLIVTGVIGWFISRYLAAYQLGYIGTAWDPFFGNASQQVLTSSVSKAWPVSDAGFGAFAYTFEALMGFMGGVNRWRTMPWMVTFFGILVIPLGLVHITLVVLQPVMVGHWCTLCLAAAAVMLVMIPLTVDEVVAMCQFLRKKMRNGEPFWKTFWKGGTVEDGDKDNRSPELNADFRRTAPAMVWGVSFPWPLLASTAIGVWMMFSPAVFGLRGIPADNAHLAGAVIVTISVIALAEVVRAGRFLNSLLGFWMILSPFVLNGTFGSAAVWNNVIAGAALILLSIPKGTIREHYGSWDRCIL